ncbi:MAG: adenylate/guanylate cyclase domain-containing protein [Gammaproteobacteria bacterium]|nr:adenylate/guanylate cyclase domain-containing protein [Gammaproteobacteria bacterium]
MRHAVKGLLLGMMIGLIGSLLGLSPYGTIFERSVGLDWLFSTRGAINPPSGVVVIAIDGTTGGRLDIPNLPRDWPRSIHGELVDALVKYGASAIVFDIDFQRERSPVDEQIFAEAAKRSNRVVLFQHLTGKGQRVEDATGKILGSVWVEELVSPIPALTNVARGLGPFPLPKIDAAVYEFWVFKSSAREAPTMPAVGFQLHALKAYRQFYRLLTDSGVAQNLELPESVEGISTAEDLRNLMTDIRARLVAEPMLIDNLLRELDAPWIQAESAEVRHVLRSLVAMYVGDNERYLNFYGPPGTIKTIPFHAVIKGADANTTAEDLNLTNKVAFVGFSDLYDPGQPDRFYTVFTDEDSIDLSGVEIAATAFGNLLHDQSLQVPDALKTLAILFGFGLFMILLVYLTPAIMGVPASIVVTAGYVFYAQFVFNGSYLWLPLATPVLVQFPLALFIGLLIQYLQQRHQVQHISEAIKLYVPDAVSQALANEDLKPENIDQVSFSTCLATDMQGFSTLAESMDPGELAEFLNDYFDSLAQPLRNHDATVTEFRADAIMCAWTGQPSDIEVRRKPILASLEAADAIEDFKARHDAFEAALRIGLETGEVYIGHSGGGGHFVYSIVGDCANTASRIEGLNKHLSTEVLATESVIEGIDDLLLRPLGQFVFVGKTEPLPIIEILSLATDATPQETELCDRFSAGLDLFMESDWKKASKQFKAILKDYPHDGPARFYISQCKQRIGAASLSDNPNVIKMIEK